MTQLPQNRQLKEIGDICNFQNGFAFKSSLFKEKGLPIIRISNIQKDQISFNRIVYFDINDYNKDLSQYLIEKGDVLIAMSGATTGKLAINQKEEKIYLNQRVGKLSFNDDATKRYTYLYLSTKIEENLNRSVGAAIPNLSSTQIKEIKIPLPPLSTQKIIVAKLDEIFANLDQTKSEIQKNIDATDEVWKSSLNRVFEEGELKTISNLVIKGEKRNPKEIEENIFEYIDISSIDKNIFILTETKKIKGVDAPSRAKQLLKKNDIIFATTRPNLKNIALIDFEKEYLTASTGFCVLRANQEQLSYSYLFYFVITDGLQEQIKPYIRGAQYPAISDKDLKSLKIPLPPLSKQKEIVAHLDQLSNETKQLKSKYQSQLDHIEELRKSVLDQAFKGELI